MYGYQGNNSQPYNYQNSNASSYSNIGQYPGPYHSYYGNAPTTYNTFPSNDQPCSSLGVIPQEYSQVGNGIPRPYYLDSNSSYPRSYQALPYNQTLDLPIASSYSSCPRNCHCCETITPKYFAASNSLQQQVANPSTFDSSLNAPYNGFRKGLSAGRWRESSSQQSNIHEANDSSSGWSMPKYGTSCKSEPYMWPLAQKQPTKFDNADHLPSGNACMLSQQHQRKPIPNSQTYSVLHSNSLLPAPASRPSQGRSNELMGNFYTGYSCSPDYKKTNSEHTHYPKPHANKIAPPSRPTCNMSSNYEGGFPYKFSSVNANVYHENQRCAIDSPKLVTQMPSTLVDSIQRRLPASSVLDRANEISYCQPGLISSVHSIDGTTRRSYSIPTEGDPRMLLNCSSSASNDVLPASRLQLPPIHSLKPTGIVMRSPPKEFCTEFSYETSKSSCKNNSGDGYRNVNARTVTLPSGSIRNMDPLNCENVSSRSIDNECRTQSEIGNSCSLTDFIPSSRYAGKQFYSEQSSEFAEADNKLRICADMPVRPLQSIGGNSAIGDLRHFLSTWDDDDDEESNSVATCVLSVGNEGRQERRLQDKCPSVNHLPEETDGESAVMCGNSAKHIVEPKDLTVNNTAYECTNSYKVYDTSSDSNSLHAHAGVGNSVISRANIPPNTCSSNYSVMKSGVDLNLGSNLRSPETYTELRVHPESSSDVGHIVDNISEKAGNGNHPPEEDLNVQNNGAVDGGEPITSLKGSVEERNSDVLNSSISHVFPPDVVDRPALRENPREAQLHHCDGLMDGVATSSCSVNLERHISVLENSESQSTLPKECARDDPRSEKVDGVTISSSSKLPKATDIPTSTLCCNQDLGNFLSSEHTEYPPDSLVWPNSGSKNDTSKSDAFFVGNNLEVMKANTLEIQSNHIEDDEIVTDHDLKDINKCHVNHCCNEEQELVPKKDILDGMSFGHDECETVSNLPAGVNGVSPGKLISDSPSEEVITDVKENNVALSTENVITTSHLKNTDSQNSLDREMFISPQMKTLDGIFSCHEGNQEQNQLDMLTSMPSTKNSLHKQSDIRGNNAKLLLSKIKGVPMKYIHLKSKAGGKGKFTRSRMGLPGKSSFKAALQLTKKYSLVRLKTYLRAKLAERQNDINVSQNSSGVCVVRSETDICPTEKKEVESHVENLSIRGSCLDALDSIEHQIILCEDNNAIGEDMPKITSVTDNNGEKLKVAGKFEEEDDNEQIIDSVYSGQVNSFKERHAVTSCEVGTVIETPSVEDDVGISVEEGEAQSLRLEGDCIIGNVEVFMGTAEDPNSSEGAIEEVDMENILHEEPPQDESNNMQYWSNYELGNDLGVAMEIEVGPEVHSSDSVELKQQVEAECFSYDAINAKVEIVGGITDHQRRKKEEVSSLSDIRTTSINDQKSKVPENCFSAEVEDEKDKYLCIENHESFANDVTTCSLENGNSEKHSVKVKSNIVGINSQSVAVPSQSHSAKEDLRGNCSQEGGVLRGSLFSGLSSESGYNDKVMPLTSCVLENSEEIVASNQRSHQLNVSKTSKLKITPFSNKGRSLHKRFKKIGVKIKNSGSSSAVCDLNKSCSKLLSHRELQMEENSLHDSVNSNQIQGEDDQRSISMARCDSASNFVKEKERTEQKIDVDCKSETNTQQNSIEAIKCDSSRFLHFQRDKYRESELPGTGINEVTRAQSIKLKCNHISGSVKDTMVESTVKCHQKETSRNRPLVKTKASMKSFDQVKLKSLNGTKFGFWKNRSWNHKRIFGQNLKKLMSLQNWKNSTRHIMPQNYKHRLPQILQICFTPPPKALSPLPMLEETVKAPGDETFPDFSPPRSNTKCVVRDANDNDAFPNNHSSLAIKEVSSDSGSFRPHSNSSHLDRNSYQDIPEKCLSEGNSVPLSPVNSIEDSQQQANNREMKISRIQNEKDVVSDSHFVGISPLGDTISPLCKDTKVDSGSAIMNSWVNMDSSSSTLPHVRISFKKVLNGSKKNMWMKRPLTSNPVRKEDFSPLTRTKTAKNMSSMDSESPLPKVTIKKKSGEKGYQSFLSGFSSASSSPSTSPTFPSKSCSPPHIVTTSSEKLPMGMSKEFPLESTNDGVSTEEFQASVDATRFSNSHSIEDVKIPSEHSTDRHTSCTNVVEKKEGSGLVFVIRALGGKVKGCSVKDKDRKHSPPAKDCGHISGNSQDSSACAARVVDDDWELGPWSVWQPVVKLSRSCEIDHLALKLNSVHEGSGEKVVHGKPPSHSESQEKPAIPVNVMPPQSVHHLSQDKSKEPLPKGKSLIGRKSDKNQYGEIILNRKGQYINFGTNKVEFDMVMRECDRLNLPKRNPKPGNKYQSSHKPSVSRDTHLSNPGPCGVKKCLLSKKTALTELGPTKSIIEESQLIKGKVDLTEKNYCRNESESQSDIPLKETLSDCKIKESVEDSDRGNCNVDCKGGRKAKRKTESEGGASDAESIVKLTKSKVMSSPGMKNGHVLSKSIPDEGWEGRVKHKEMEDSGGPESSCVTQEPVEEDLLSMSPNDVKGSDNRSGEHSSYACEACCRTFSSRKWLSRHCRGVSHFRVENAQRQAVQALLLLLTGTESHLLQPLTEKELSHLKRWSSRAVPSPLQLALNEFLNAT